MAYKTVDAQFVLDNLGKIPLMDVRPADMYAQSRIPGAISVSLMAAKEAEGDTADAFVQAAKAAGFEPQDEFIVYCYHGVLATEACEILDSKGYEKEMCYLGSWLDWTSDPSRPIDSDPA